MPVIVEERGPELRVSGKVWSPSAQKRVFKAADARELTRQQGGAPWHR